MTSELSLRARLEALPAEWSIDLRPEIQRRLAEQPRTVVVLDDDPTGTQTVHSIPVLTEWPVPALAEELAREQPAFYVLTNSRSMPLAAAEALNAEIGRNLAEAARQTNREFVVVSRSDSTLRGHFPGEVAALDAALGGGCDGWLLAPYFLEGGRYTLDDVHYVASGDLLTPAGETEFARDPAFGYRASNLREWVEEKSAGMVRAADVASISLDDIRRGGPERVAERLMALNDGRMCVVNAANPRDLDVVVAGLLDAEARGKRFLYRTAASFVAARAGLTSRSLLTRDELALPANGGGLTMVGSFVPRTTSQVAALVERTGVPPIEASVAALIDDAQRDAEISRVAQAAEERLGRGDDVAIVTSRQLIAGADAGASLDLGRRVSDGLCAILQAIETRPRYLIAKGGITSSDLATQGLGVRRAMVLGQILPGVPVWRLGDESRYPGLVYVVFPGNVGGPEALADVVELLHRTRD
ncbi:MAG TPA: four-carbon acid sugar kinase family protein [Roseiflexaceae bacterium]|nr:four-carbon acid sugar kinase family protein [Roseiflexaceae bacterium]